MISEKNQETKNVMLKEYLSNQLLYVEFTSYIENKIKNILIENNIKYQSLSSRVKTYDSLSRKLTEKIINGVCKNIKKLNDLSGVRVIFYDEEELKIFNRIIYEEFNVEMYRPPKDIMEYDGINVTISLKKDINKFKGLLCEIQLTTVLSHAMNEFGHNIIYKDIDELKSKDSREYEKIRTVFSETRKDVLKIMANLEFINRRVYSIKSGAQNIELLLGNDFKEKLLTIDSLDKLEDVINKMIEVIPLVNQYEERYITLYDSGIIYSIVKKFSELPVETAKFLNYDTYDYKFDKLLEFLQSYKYLWISDFKEIISIIYTIASDKSFLIKFDKFIENLIISDKADSSRGYANYNIHEKILSLICDKNLEEYIRIKLAEYFCNINYSYCEESGINQVSITNGKVNPNENYINKIYKVIEVVLEIFTNHYSKDTLNTLININCELERNNEIFKLNPIYEFFDNNYERIDIFSKNELYKSVCFWKNTKLRKSNFYKKLIKDKTQNLFALIFNNFIEEIPNSGYKEKEEYRINFINEYITSFKRINIKEIISILEAMDNDEINSLNIYHAGSFFIKIGSLDKYGKEILKRKWNEFILLGVMNQDPEYGYAIEDETKARKIVQAMIRVKNQDLKMLNLLINYSEENKKKDIELKLIEFIFNSTDLLSIEEYKKYALGKIKQYNYEKEGIIGAVLYNLEAESQIIEDYDYDDICVLLENTRYSEINRTDELWLNALFEKYPSELREVIRQKVRDNPNANLYNSYNYINLTDCNNFNDERYNNLILCLELLDKNNYYEISNYIHFLIGEFDENLERDILKYLNDNDNYYSYSIVVALCKLFDVSISCWKIYEHIISKINYDDKLLDEIDCLLFNTGVVSGEYGLANAFHNKYVFFQGLKTKNKKIKAFVNEEISRFENLYIEEKNKTDKEMITKSVKYDLEKKKINEN